MKNNYIDPIPPELRQVLAWTEKLNELTRDVPIVNELSQLKENCLVEETPMATAIKQTVRPLTNGITDLGIDMGCSPIMEENRKITEMFQPTEMFNAIKQTEAFNNLVNIKKLYSFHDVTSEWIINPLTTFLYETNYIKVNEFNNALSNESLEFTKSIEPLCVSPVIDWIDDIPLSLFSEISANKSDALEQFRMFFIKNINNIDFSKMNEKLDFELTMKGELYKIGDAIIREGRKIKRKSVFNGIATAMVCGATLYIFKEQQDLVKCLLGISGGSGLLKFISDISDYYIQKVDIENNDCWFYGY